MNRSSNSKWSLVVMRGADKTVKQFHVSKRSVIAAPAAAALAVSGCFAALQLKSVFELHELEAQLQEQATQQDEQTQQYQHTVSNKDETILALQQQLASLAQQTEDMQTRVDELLALENKLKQFIDKYGSSDSGIDTSNHKLGQQSEQPHKREQALAQQASYDTSGMSFRALASSTSFDVQSLSAMVDSLEETMAQTLRQAQTKRQQVDSYPSSWPTYSKKLTSSFGYRKDPFSGKAVFHAGIDIGGKAGDPVFSAADGTIKEVGTGGSEGNYIIVDHHNGLNSVYMHLQSIEAKEGEQVVRGEKIGLLGSTGRSTGPHLHFQIMQGDEAVNPLPYLLQPS
ncbi:Murein DD-endopeptidase MepM and murein hydrolase activator NlpD, contain LysM domain [Paenibacillus algorifonticola]|uniref:Murein DD-endopeptidase MepM and murein hydrolase activator NlpD, contain LysM domain n=1 Tax=Paenibacillus algorifonticola TaxID=684063 RepID=A0A1I2E1G7_9BACL|nr:M23 family metallopeptidase [Paenibacillus algorifonticola]SFE86418.1 Murein DD-endopeptidase MepM and murein hydrolase activator NlpD, contain LysM domain [Paenibacillus algorifonticola]